MEIFHYCAMRLKDVPLFESCSNTEIVREVTFEDSETGAEEIESNEEGSSVETSGISDVEVNDSDIEKAFLLADENDMDRWVIDSDLFDGIRDIDDPYYQRKVLEAVDCWDDLPVFHDHIERYIHST